MSYPVIKIENLSKAYQIGQIGSRTLSRDAERFWKTKILGKEDPFLKIGETNDRNKKGNSDIVWSLRNINLEILQGQAIGIIGKNGAGKSTLLKILSRVTSPTIGQIKIKGRIASLLEVGTGFHPELTGLENIYLNGAILGMRKKEIKQKLDEIIDFSGVERYIDTPVKRYSSGMYVRLAFAVAAHLESEILVVDEVLAVGDIEFQKKCLGKMDAVSRNEGRTVLFVSHNMATIMQLCSSAILLKDGQLAYAGLPKEVVSVYIKDSDIQKESVYINLDSTGLIYYFESVEMIDLYKKNKSEYSLDEAVILHIKLAVKKYNPAIELGVALLDKWGNRVFTIHENLYPKLLTREKDKASFSIKIPARFLAPGIYRWIAVIHIPHQQAFHVLNDICSFSIIDTGTNFSDYGGAFMGVVLPAYSIEHD